MGQLEEDANQAVVELHFHHVCMAINKALSFLCFHHFLDLGEGLCQCLECRKFCINQLNQCANIFKKEQFDIQKCNSYLICIHHIPIFV